jgi:cytochrome c oxidase subunit 4
MTATARTTVAWLALLVLTGSSFGASFLHLGAAAVPIALSIAVVKATVVVLAFMELRHEGASTRVALFAGIAMVVLLVFFVVADVVMRAPAPLPSAAIVVRSN